MNKKLEVLQLFAEVAEQYTDAQTYRLREGYVPVIKHDIAKREWRAANKELQRIYDRRYYARKTGKPLPPIKVTYVEIYWDGQAFYYAKPNDPEKLGGPFETAHKAWKHADKKKFIVVDLLKSKGSR